MKKIINLEKILKTNFKNKTLLKQALVHKSYINEHPKFKLNNNERMEFLGDAVLELVVTKFLYKNFNKPEGELTSLRSSLVNTKSLSRVAIKLEIKEYLYLSKGEDKSKGKSKEVILANTLESIIGAIYLDKGFANAEKFILTHLISRLDIILKHKLYKDPKGLFQEIIQKKFKITPTYKMLKQSGPEHNKQFICGVYIKDKLIASGKGNDKQSAETQAAKKALKKQIIKI